MDEQNPFLRGVIVLDGNRIDFVGEQAPEPREAYKEIISGKGKLWMPGLVNTHGHAAMSLLRGYGDDLALKVWLEEKMWPNEAKFTGEDVKWGTQLSILEMVKGGTTSFVDMYDHMDQVAQAVESSGLRACLTRGVIGNWCPEEVAQNKLKEAAEFARNWHGGAGGRITAMMSPHAPYTCSPGYVEQIVQVAHDLNLPLHTHMSETLQEVLANEQEYGLRPVAHLEKHGLFSRPALVAHAVHLTDEEIAILKKYDVRVSHNPGSNLKLASGVARVPDLLKAGVKVSLGTDGPASNNNLDMFEEMRLAALIHKGVSGDPVAVPAVEALKMGTVVGAQSIWLDDVGVLKSGMKADLISLDVEQAHFYPRTDYASHVVYSASAKDVADVCVDGKWLVRGGECLTIDEERVRYEAQRCFERITGSAGV
ncbi:amidohydrolase [Paenibacillus sp. y28]|uniref:amidohydrolase n=1 Tax=Paenibacillus sp. y28 TaxID=3129110 RepID=UPI0030185CBC